MSNKITLKGISVTQGDSLPLVLDFHQDIEDAEIHMQVKDETGRILIDKKTTEHLNPRLGHALINITSQDTSLPIGKYITDMEITFNDGTRYTFYPPKVGEAAFFEIKNQITKEKE